MSSEGSPDARLLWLLGAGVVGLTWSLTTVAAYLPELLHRFTSSRALVGAILGAEGVVAIVAPLLIGPLSDRTRTRLGRRRPFMLVAVPAMVAALGAVALMPSLGLTAGVLACFFVAYYVYETPYRSLYADLLPRDAEARAQSIQHVLRGIAIALALVLGGVLLSLWRPLPFVLAAGVVVASAATTLRTVHEDRPRSDRAPDGDSLWQLVRESRKLRIFLAANTGWEATFAGMRTFVVLYIVQGLHQPLYVSSAVLAVVAAGYIVAAAVAGRAAERAGTARVVLTAATIYGIGLCPGVFPKHWHWVFLGLVFVVAVAAGVVMTLAWTLLYEVMPEGDRGASAGLASATKGAGLLIGPALAGGSIDLCRGLLPATDGYAVMWPVLAVPVLATLPLVLLLRRRR